MIAPRETEHEYDVDHRGDLFYIRTNDRGRNFRARHRAGRGPAPGELEGARPAPRRRDARGHRPLRGLTRRLRARGRPAAHPRHRPRRRGASHRVEFPEPVYAVGREHERGVRHDDVPLRLPVASRRRRRSSTTTWTRASATLLKQHRGARRLRPGALQARSGSSRRPPTARGSRSRSSTGRASRATARPRCCSTATAPTASPSRRRFQLEPRVSLLDRGVVFAIAHIRGGGEMGKHWHDQGKMLRRRTPSPTSSPAPSTSSREKYTSKDRLVDRGRQRRRAAHGRGRRTCARTSSSAVIARVPFVDVINTMLDESLPLTVGEFEEWGNPQDQGAVRLHEAYSPYDNLAAKAYPAMLVKTSLQRQPGHVLGAGQVRGASCGRSRPTTTRCSSRSTWPAATAAPRAATTAAARRRSTTPSS